MHLGLVGGIGPAATDVYYRGLIRRAAADGVDLDCTIVHADTPTLLANMTDGRIDDQVSIYRRLTDRLSAAGADVVAITSISGHFCIEPFAAVSPLPVIDLLTELDRHLRQAGIERAGLLGTATVMRSRMYDRMTGTELLVPEGDLLERVHDAYVEMASSGVGTPAQRAVFDEAIAEMTTAGAETVLLGGTDLGLLYGEDDDGVLDCAAVHIEALARLAAD